MNKPTLITLAFASIAGLALVGCGSSEATKTDTPSEGAPKTTEGNADLKGKIVIDGSSTVYKATSVVAEDFNAANKGVEITVNISGTGGGFKKFCAGETDISNASRSIEDKEIELAKKNGVEFVEIPVFYDGLSVVVNKENTWVDKLTVEELKKIWQPEAEGKIMKWSDVRAGWPAEPIKLYGPDADSGTFDYFTKVIVGKEKSSRTDYQMASDDNIIVKGVSGDKGGLGYFGLAYYLENTETLKAVPIDSGKGPVAPSAETVLDQSYRPLSRPEFIYVSKKAFDRPEVKAFIEFYLGPEGQAAIKEVKYVPFKSEVYDKIHDLVKQGATGSKFVGKTGESVESVLGL